MWEVVHLMETLLIKIFSVLLRYIKRTEDLITSGKIDAEEYGLYIFIDEKEILSDLIGDLEGGLEIAINKKRTQ